MSLILAAIGYMCYGVFIMVNQAHPRKRKNSTNHYKP